MFIKRFHISESEKQTFKLHMIFNAIDGMIVGIFALNEFVLIKALKGTDYQIGFLFQFSVVVLLLSVFLNELQKRTKNKTKMLRIVALLTRSPLLLFFFFPITEITPQVQIMYQYIFLAIFLLYFLSNAHILPVINLILKKNYKHENFGKYYGYATTLNKIVILISTFFFGLLLDFYEQSYRYVYPFVAIMSISSIFILTKINYQQPELTLKIDFISSIKRTYKNMTNIVLKNKPFRDFEIGFMLYGFAWMVSVSVITIFFEKVLHLNYSGVAFYKNSYNTIAIIVLPFFGKLLGRIDPRKFSVYAFIFMIFYMFFMGITEFFPYYFEVFEIKIYWTLILSYLSYGIFAAMMALLWYIGSAYFCKDEDVADYQSVHLVLTGVRGVFAPLIGIFFYQIIGFFGVFSLGIFSLLLALLVLRRSMKKY